MIRAVSDTHAVIWSGEANPQRSPAAKAVFDAATAANEQVAVSSISLVEIVSLGERQRIDPDTLAQILDFIDLKEVLVEFPVDRSILPAPASIDRASIPDMPDRIIAATALPLGVPLISRDRKLRTSSVQTIW